MLLLMLLRCYYLLLLTAYRSIMKAVHTTITPPDILTTHMQHFTLPPTTLRRLDFFHLEDSSSPFFSYTFSLCPSISIPFMLSIATCADAGLSQLTNPKPLLRPSFVIIFAETTFPNYLKLSQSSLSAGQFITHARRHVENEQVRPLWPSPAAGLHRNNRGDWSCLEVERVVLPNHLRARGRSLVLADPSQDVVVVGHAGELVWQNLKVLPRRVHRHCGKGCSAGVSRHSVKRTALLFLCEADFDEHVSAFDLALSVEGPYRLEGLLPEVVLYKGATLLPSVEDFAGAVATEDLIELVLGGLLGDGTDEELAVVEVTHAEPVEFSLGEVELDGDDLTADEVVVKVADGVLGLGEGLEPDDGALGPDHFDGHDVAVRLEEALEIHLRPVLGEVADLDLHGDRGQVWRLHIVIQHPYHSIQWLTTLPRCYRFPWPFKFMTQLPHPRSPRQDQFGARILQDCRAQTLANNQLRAELISLVRQNQQLKQLAKKPKPGENCENCSWLKFKQAQLDNREKEAASLREQFGRLHSERERLLLHQKERQAEVAELREANARLQVSLARSDQQFYSLKKTVCSKLDSQSQLNRDKNDEIDRLNHLLSESDSRATELYVHNGQLSARAIQLEADLQGLSELQQKQAEQKHRLSDQLASAMSQLLRLRNTTEQGEKAKEEQSVKLFKEQSLKTAQQLASANEQLLKLQQQRVAQQQRVCELADEKQRLWQQLQQAVQQCRRKESQLATLKLQISEQQQRFGEESQRRAEQIGGLASTKQQLQFVNKEMRDQLTLMLQEISGYEAAAEEHRQELQSLRQEHQEQCTGYEQAICTLKAELLRMAKERQSSQKVQSEANIRQRERTTRIGLDLKQVESIVLPEESGKGRPDAGKELAEVKKKWRDEVSQLKYKLEEAELMAKKQKAVSRLNESLKNEIEALRKQLKSKAGSQSPKSQPTSQEKKSSELE